MTLTPINKCPTCGYCLDAATCVNGERAPRPDDVSAYLKCGELLVFTKDLTMRAMDLNDMLGLDERTKYVSRGRDTSTGRKVFRCLACFVKYDNFYRRYPWTS